MKTPAVNGNSKIAIPIAAFLFSVYLILLDKDNVILSSEVYIKEFVLCSILYTCILSVPVYGLYEFCKSILRDIRCESAFLKQSKNSNE